MGIHYFPCHFVYWRKIKNHENFKKRLLDEIENNRSVFKKHPLVDGGVSSYNENQNFNNYMIYKHRDIIKEVVWDSIYELLKELNSRNGHCKINIRDSVIGNSWISIYDKKSSVGCHCHAGIFTQDEQQRTLSFVVVYILNDPNESNTTEFIQPFGQIPTTSRKLEYNFNTNTVNEIREGVVMIFPANLYHQVNTMEKENRIIYTFNIASSFINW